MTANGTHSGDEKEARHVATRKAVGAGILAILVPLVAAAEASFKSLIDDWFDTCSIVIDQEEIAKEKGGSDPFVAINLLILGKTPRRAQLIVSSGDQSNVINRIKFWNDISGNNRAFHSSSGHVERNEDGAKTMPFDISPLDSKYQYKFKVYVDPNKEVQIRSKEILLGTFIEFPGISDDENKEICRVSQYTTLDILIGADNVGRFGALFIFVGLMGVAVYLLRSA